MQNHIFKSTTLLITIKDQITFTKQLIDFLNLQPVTINIFVADGSKNNQKKLFKKLKHKYRYIYYGEDKNLKDYYLKIYSSLKIIKTNFVFFCDQDDFINFSCLKNKENFLIHNNDYSAAKGFLYNFEGYKNTFFLREKTYPKEIKNKKFLLSRFINNLHFRSYYCLHRKKNLFKIFKIIIKNKTADARTAEFIMDVSTLLLGQIYLINECSLLRWMGNKYNTHPIRIGYKTRAKWFFGRIFKNDQLINNIILLNKNLKLSIFSFKLIIFIFDIVTLFFENLFNSLKRSLIRLLYIFKSSFTLNRYSFKISKINQTFIVLNNRLRR
jgi:glycosyltransferase domain-containing protein